MSDFINEPGTELPGAQDQNNYRRRRKDIFPGVFILAIGVIYLLKQTGVIFPYWLFTWPVLLIGIGLYSGLKHNFNGGGWMIPILIGSLFLMDDVLPGAPLRNYIWPIIIIGVGLVLIIRPKRNHPWKDWKQQYRREPITGYQQGNNTGALNDTGDYIDITTMFGGVKKIVLSKNFKGGDVVSLMAGTEVNLTQADINGVVTIDATSIFGGTKLIVPPTWNVQSEVVTIFGGVDDKRQMTGEPLSADKTLRLEGTCIFGGIDIRSY